VKGRLGVLVTPSGITYHLSLFTFHRSHSPPRCLISCEYVWRLIPTSIPAGISVAE
jgi:hypothetical protein